MAHVAIGLRRNRAPLVSPVRGGKASLRAKNPPDRLPGTREETSRRALGAVLSRRFPRVGRKRRKAVNTALSQGFAHGETQNTLRKAVEGPQDFRTWAGNVIDSSPPECLLSKGFRAGGKRPPLPGWRDGDSVEHVFGERDRDGAPYNIANQYEK